MFHARAMLLPTLALSLTGCLTVMYERVRDPRETPELGYLTRETYDRLSSAGFILRGFVFRTVPDEADTIEWKATLMGLKYGWLESTREEYGPERAHVPRIPSGCDAAALLIKGSQWLANRPLIVLGDHFDGQRGTYALFEEEWDGMISRYTEHHRGEHCALFLAPVLGPKDFYEFRFSTPGGTFRATVSSGHRQEIPRPPFYVYPLFLVTVPLDVVLIPFWEGRWLWRLVTDPY